MTSDEWGTRTNTDRQDQWAEGSRQVEAEKEKDLRRENRQSIPDPSLLIREGRESR